MGSLCSKSATGVEPIVKVITADEEAADNEPEEIVGELPIIAKSDHNVTMTRPSRVTLINRPQCVTVNSEDKEREVTIAYISMNKELDKNISTRIADTVQNLTGDNDRLLCLYAGPITTNLDNIKADVGVWKEEVPKCDCRSVILGPKRGSQLVCRRLDETIGILAFTDIDDEGKWLEFARSEADKMNRSDKPNMIVAITFANLEQAERLAKICVLGVKAILCQDTSKPSSERILYGTPIINVNPSETCVANLRVTFDNFHQAECKPTKFSTV